MSQEPFLTLHDFHLSREAGRAQVLATLARFMSPAPVNVDWHKGAIDIAKGESKKRLTFAEMEQDARRTGVVEFLQRQLDQQDPVFGGTFDTATPNFQMRIKTEYAGWSREVQGPCRIGLIEKDLMEDILHYRQQACLASSDYSFREVARHYRAYLASCISLFDAFINRHILVATHEGFDSPALRQLKESRSMEERVAAWLETCTEKTMKDLAHRKEWCHFQKLRQERNALLHVVDPFSVYRIKEIATMLNDVRTGVGELLRLLRSFHFGKATLLFIERLRTAPKVEYHSIRQKAEPQ
jgi:hypothetical protein